MPATVVSADLPARENSRWNVLRNVMGAAPLLFLALAYFLARGNEFEILGLDGRWLRQMMQIEFLVIHSFPFLGMFALFRPPWPEARAIKWVIVGLLLWLYLAFAWQAEEWKGVLYFLSLTGATYLGFFLNWTPATAVVRLVARWIANFIFFMVASGLAGMPSDVGTWAGRREALVMGCWYFALCGAVELSGFYQMPFWDRFTKSALEVKVEVKRDPADVGLSVPRIVYRGLRPILGTLCLAAAPLMIGSTVTVFLARTFGDLRSSGYLLIMLPLLLAFRWKQTRWIVHTIRGTAKPWWKRVRVAIFVSVTTLAYLISAFYGDDRLPVREAWVPSEAIERFLLAEILCLLWLIPLTWWAIVATQREKAGASSKL